MEEMTLQYSSQDLEAVDGSSEILRRTVTCTVEAVDVEAEETVPGPPHCPHPEVLNSITRVALSSERFTFNDNHPAVPDKVLLPVQKEVQKQINLANTRLTAFVRDCKSRKEFDQAIEKHENAIRQIGAKAKKKTANQLKELSYSKEDQGLVRFAVGKRFSVWRAQLEAVRKSPHSWESRSCLGSLLVEANKHQYDAYHLSASMSI